MRINCKSFYDFRKAGNKDEFLLTEAEMQRTIIIDDQYCVIHPNFRGKLRVIQLYESYVCFNNAIFLFTGSMIHSKKFVKLIDLL